MNRLVSGCTLFPFKASSSASKPLLMSIDGYRLSTSAAKSAQSEGKSLFSRSLAKAELFIMYDGNCTMSGLSKMSK